jgi:transcription antitermination protein NusB
MVNRRLLRIKAMQAMYALHNATQANYELAKDQIAEAFLPDLNSMQVQDRRKLEGMKQLALMAFEENFAGAPSAETIPTEALVAANTALIGYKNAVSQDRQRIAREMVDEVESIYDKYIKILLIVNYIVEIAVWDEQRRHIELPHKTSRLAKNVLLEKLKDYDLLEGERIRRKIGLSDEEQTLLKKLFAEKILTNQTFLDYLSKSIHTFTEDVEMVQYLVKEIVFREETIKEHFEKDDLFWNENRDVIRSLVIKTFKIEHIDELVLQPLAMNWQDDRYFFVDLYNYTLDNDTQYEQLVENQAKNWETERVAAIDLIILKMALAELINFPSIPVKVTINEFIEMAKTYSTNKSGPFVNGILDALSIKLAAENIIRKSGRGLIDNK